MEALQSIDRQQQALTKDAQVLTYSAGFNHVHQTHFDHDKQRAISMFRTASSSMKGGERDLGFRLSLMSSSTSLLCSLPRKWSCGQALLIKTDHSECTKTSTNSAILLCVGKCQLHPCDSSSLPEPLQFLRPSFSRLDSVKKIDCCRNSTVHQISDSITRSDAPDFQSACLDSAPWPCKGPVTSVVIGSLSQTAQAAETRETTRKNKHKTDQNSKQKLKMLCLKSSARLLVSSSHAGNHPTPNKYQCLYYLCKFTKRDAKIR